MTKCIYDDRGVVYIVVYREMSLRSYQTRIKIDFPTFTDQNSVKEYCKKRNIEWRRKGVQIREYKYIRKDVYDDCNSALRELYTYDSY